MNKYQKVMQHVRVDDEMKKRILQNVEKELSKEGTVKAPGMADKIVPFGKRLGDGVKRYAGIAAMFAVLFVGAAAVVKMTGGVSNMSTSTMSETAMEAPAATESAEMAEAPAAEEAAYEAEEAAEATYDSDSMAEAPAATESAYEDAEATYDNETVTEAPVEPAAETAAEPAGSAEKAESTGKTETGTVNAPAVTEQPATSVEEAAPEHVSWVHYIAPILLPIILLVVIILIIWLIDRYIRRRK